MSDDELGELVESIASEWPRFGYRRVRAMLRRERSLRVSSRRMLRVMRDRKLSIRPLAKRRERQAPAPTPMAQAHQPNQGWAFDFTSEQLLTGERIRVFSIIDECTRELIRSTATASFPARTVRRILDETIAERSAQPQWVRSDNGPEFIAELMVRYFKRTKLVHARSRPGKPTDHARIESFHSRFRDELLDRQLFKSVADAQEQIDAYRARYDHRRPHSSLNYSTPAEFAATFTSLQSPMAPVW